MSCRPLPKLCDVENCPNSRRGLAAPPPALSVSSGDALPLSYHGLPAEESRRVLWLNAVRLKKEKEKLSSAKVCSRHFAPSDYVRDPALSQAFGVPYRRPKLAATAVPSMAPQRLEDRGGSSAAAVDQALLLAGAEEAPDDRPAVRPSSRGVGHDKGLQARVRPRSVGVQVNTTLRERDHRGAQTDAENDAPAPGEWPGWEIVHVYLLPDGTPAFARADGSSVT